MELGETGESIICEDDIRNIFSKVDLGLYLRLEHLEIPTICEVDYKQWIFFNEIHQRRIGVYIQQMVSYIRLHNLLEDPQLLDLLYQMQHAKDRHIWQALKCRLQSPILSFIGINPAQTSEDIKICFRKKFLETDVL